MNDLLEISLADMIKEAEREVIMRRNVYARRVQNRMMTQSKADLKIATMEKIVETLKEHASCPSR